MITDAEMTVEGIDSMDFNTTQAWEAITAEFSTDFFLASGTLNTYQTTISVTAFVARRRYLSEGNVRGLQTSPSLLVVYDQEFVYSTDNDQVTAESLATTPFSRPEYRDAYTTVLVESGEAGLADVTGTSAVSVPEDIVTEAPTELNTAPTASPWTNPPTDDPNRDDDDNGGLSTGAIIGIACAGGVALILCALGVFFMSGGDDEDKDKEDAPNEVKVAAVTGGDEISTLEPPPAGAASGSSLAEGYGDQR